MTSITTLRPNATIAIHPDMVVTGAANAHTALSDDSDATSVDLTISDGNTRSLVLGLPDITVAAGTFVQQVRVRVKYVNTGVGIQTSITPNLQDLSGNKWGSTTNAQVTLPITYTGPWRTIWPKGAAANQIFTQSVVNSLQVALDLIVNLGFGWKTISLIEVYVDVQINNLPTTTVTAPTGTVTLATRPTVTATYNDSDNDAMDRYRVKVFNSAQYGAGGFDPEISACDYDSGDVSQQLGAGFSFSQMPNVDLINGASYRAYVKVRQFTRYQWSTWAFSSFTVSLDPPATPTISGAVDDANGRIALTYQGRDNLLSKNQADLETDTTGWAAGASTSIVRATSPSLHGVASLQLTRNTSTGTASATTPTGTLGTPVVAGQQYTVLASFRAAVSATARQVSTNIVWYNAAGSVISTTTGTTTADSTSAWTSAPATTATAPALSAFASVTVLVAGAIATEIHFVDMISFAPGASTTWTRGGFVGAGLYRATLQRSDDGGVTWGNFALNDFVAPIGSLMQVVYDYTAPLATSVLYRAVTYGIDNLELASAFSTSAGPYTSTPVTSTGWIIKDTFNPANNQVIDLDMQTWDTQADEEQAVYKPLGSKYVIVVSDVIRGISGTLKPSFKDQASYNAWLALRNSQDILLLQRVYTSEQWYIRLAQQQTTKEEPSLYRVVTVDFNEVGPSNLS